MPALFLLSFLGAYKELPQAEIITILRPATRHFQVLHGGMLCYRRYQRIYHQLIYAEVEGSCYGEVIYLTVDALPKITDPVKGLVFPK